MISRRPPVEGRFGYWKAGRMFVRVPPQEQKAFQGEFPRSTVAVKAYGEFVVFEIRDPSEQTAALVTLEFLPPKS